MKFIIGILGSIIIIATTGLLPGSLFAPVSKKQIHSETKVSQKLKKSRLNLSDSRIEVWNEEYPEYVVRIN